MKKFVARIIVCACLALGLWIVWRHYELNRLWQTRFIPGPAEGISGTPARPGPPEVAAAETELKRPAGMDDAGWRFVTEMRNRLLEANKPIRFYARAVDQEDQPVVGAVLKAALTRVDEQILKPQNFLRSKPGDEVVKQPIELISDSSGWFRLEGLKGRFLVVESLSCKGYLWSFDGYKSFDYDRPNPTEEFKDPQKGYTFHLWKKRETERLATIGFPVPIQPYGTNWYAVNLFGGPVNDAQSADFRFWFETKKDAAGNSAREFRFEVADGGLVLDRGPYPYQAPEMGYVATLDWSYEPFGRDSKQDLKALLKKQFYVKIRNGKVYGAITWHWADANVVSITAYLNPSGSRNLEPDPDKLITDPVEIQRLDKQSRDR